jgi:hypothetical protein
LSAFCNHNGSILVVNGDGIAPPFFRQPPDDNPFDPSKVDRLPLKTMAKTIAEGARVDPLSVAA